MKKTGNTKALLSSKSTEWYTPSKYIEAAREVMGSIDIDPASDDFANQTVKATMYYDERTNGFDKRWIGNIWMNPPYCSDGGRSNQARWSQRLIEQYQAGITKQAILLVNNVTETRWFQPLWQFPICFTSHRISFYNQKKEPGQPTHGNVFVYMGPHVTRFFSVFKRFGHVVTEVGLSPATLWTQEEVA